MSVRGEYSLLLQELVNGSGLRDLENEFPTLKQQYFGFLASRGLVSQR